MTTAALAANPFALMLEPAAVRATIENSEELARLAQRRCHPLDRAVIRSASAELAAYDAKIDRTTIYLPPDESGKAGVLGRYVRPYI